VRPPEVLKPGRGFPGVRKSCRKAVKRRRKKKDLKPDQAVLQRVRERP
jgi:hypothetical protein